MNAGYAVILVDSTSHALHIEKLLVAAKLDCKLIPVPRHLSSDCGVCVRISQPDLKLIKPIIDQRYAQYRSIEVL